MHGFLYRSVGSGKANAVAWLHALELEGLPRIFDSI